MALFKDQGRRMVLAAPCGAAAAHDGIMQLGHKVCQRGIAPVRRYSAIEALLSCKVVQVADELD